jgi:hypothetical protein
MSLSWNGGRCVRSSLTLRLNLRLNLRLSQYWSAGRHRPGRLATLVLISPLVRSIGPTRPVRI